MSERRQIQTLLELEQEPHADQASCPACGAAVQATYRYCPMCGESAPTERSDPNERRRLGSAWSSPVTGGAGSSRYAPNIVPPPVRTRKRLRRHRTWPRRHPIYCALLVLVTAAAIAGGIVAI